MRKTLLVGFALIALLTVSITGSIPFSGYAQQDQTKADKFIEIAQRANEQAMKLRDRAENAGADVAAATVLIEEGESLLTQALDENDSVAFETARDAQGKFRDAIKALDVEEEGEEEKGKGILVAAARAEERIQKLKNVRVASTLENEMYLNQVNDNITEAEQKLNDARAAVAEEPADVSKASQLLEEAKQNIAGAFKALKSVGDWTISWRGENFLKGLQKQLEKAKDRLDRLAQRSLEIDDNEVKVSVVQELMQQASDALDAGDRKAALDLIKDARKTLQGINKNANKPQGLPGQDEGPGQGRGRGQGRGQGQDGAAQVEIDTITFVDFRRPSHAGPGPDPSECSDTYHFTRGGLKWSESEVKYSIFESAESTIPENIGMEGASSAMGSAFGSWKAKADASPKFSEGTSTNTVSWQSLGTGGIVAYASISYYPATKEIVAFRIVFNNNVEWSMTTEEGAFTLLNVATHEVGHVEGLDHVNAPKDGLETMYRYTSEGEPIKLLCDGDGAGIQALYSTTTS